MSRFRKLISNIQDWLDDLAKISPQFNPESTKVKFAIIVGHTREKAGALGKYPIAKAEYFYNSEIASSIFQRAKEKGIDCEIFFRDSGGISGAYAEVHRWVDGARKACAIELHFNAFNGKVRGTETLHDDDPAESREFAQIVHEGLVEAFGRTGKLDRGLKRTSQGDRGHYNLDCCLIPSCIIEPFFGDSIEDAHLAHSKRVSYVESIVRSVENFLRT